MRVRRALLTVHRWLGLTAGLVLLVSGTTGALLVLLEPLDRWANATLFRVAPGATAAPIDRILDALQAQHPGADISLRLPRAPGDALVAYVKGDRDLQAYFDPADGRLLGTREATEGVYNFVFELHSELLASQGGRKVLAAAALGYAILFGVGLLLWWPRDTGIGRALRVRWGRAATIVTLDLHRTAGALLGVLLLLSVASGAYMAWRPISHWVDALSGAAAPAVPRVRPGEQRLGADAVVRLADEAMPGGRLSIVQWPGDPTRAVRVRKQLPDEVHPNGLSSVWVDPYAGRVVAQWRWNEPPLGTRAFQWMYPLHTGALGGVAHEAFTFVLGLVLAALGGSGVWLWWRGRAARAAGARRELIREPTT